MRSIRGGKGLGDALYVQAVARHFLKRGERLVVRSNWPDVFRPLGLQVRPFTREGVNIVAHYAHRRRHQDTTQFRDCWETAGLREPVELKLDWTVLNDRIVDQLPKPYVCVQLPRCPMDKPGLGDALLPDCAAIQRMIDRLKSRFAIVQVGAGTPLYQFNGIDLDLANRTSVSDLLDVAAGASGFLGYVSYFVPLAESLDKPAMFVWSSRGLVDRASWFVPLVTPKKILHKPSCQWVTDDAPQDERDARIDAFLR